MALLLAGARNVPQAHAALVQGRWERSKWEGVELADKTLGIIGLGRIGKLVAQRALAFGMKLVAYDPFVSADRRSPALRRPRRPRAAHGRLRLRHDPRRQDEGDDRAHRQRSRSRTRSPASGSSTSPAAASSTRPRSPRRSAPARSGAPRSTCSTRSRRRSRRCSSCPQVVVTPHLGASTREAQDKAATRSPTWCSSPSPASSCRSP